MSTALSPDLSADQDNQITLLAKQWYAAIAPWSFAEYACQDMQQRLSDLARQAHELLFTADIHPNQARPLGIALVDLHYNQPEVLEQTLLLLEQHLRTWWPDQNDRSLQKRLAVLLAGTAAGFVQQTRQVVLTEQERFQRATLMAHLQAEQELRASEEYLRMVLDNAPLGMIVIEKDGTIRLVAGRIKHDFPYALDDLIGQSFPEQFAHLSKIQQGYQCACAGKTTRWEQVYQDRYYEIIFGPLYDKQGRINGVSGLGIDITSRMQAQIALEHERAGLEARVKERTLELEQSNAELKRLNQVKDEFLAMMSHELRTPLHAILILSEAIRSDTHDTLSETQAHRLHQIEQSSLHLKTMLSDILDLTRIGAGKLKLHIQPVKADEICLMALKLIEQEARANDLRIAVSLDPDVTTILTDPRRLKQILLNLLDNAVKFTNPGGTIGLQMVGDKERQIIEWIVWDTGIGIADEDLSRLFQPFVQLDSSLTRRYEGSGLGLVLVDRLADLLGGWVEVLSEPECGSRFSLFLPWRATAAEPEPVEPHRAVTMPQRTMSDQRTIVLAEDEPISAALFCDFLTTRGYKVTLASNGIEAVEQTRQIMPDLVVMDIQMPEMDGLEAIHQIRAIANLSHTPIIAMTAMAMQGDDVRCIEAGANEYVSKPVSLQKLLEVIEMICYPDLKGESKK